MDSWTRKGKFSLTALTLQIVFILLFAIFADYDYGADAKHDFDLDSDSHRDAFMADHPDVQRLDANFMAMFQDVHVMIFVGFGFLMVFLKRYGYSSVGFNMLTAAFAIQWAILMGGFLHLHDGKIMLSISTLFTADFAAAAVLISFGAVLGRLSPLQMLMMAMLEITIFQVNEWMGLSIFKAVDVGGSMFVHVFGAYFGIGMSMMLAHNAEIEQGQISRKNEASYYSDLFAMIGTIFLWIFWPSFNSALAVGNAQQRAVINSYVALASCCVVAFAVSTLVHPKDKLEMAHIQNATLAGGVAIGTSADMMIHPFGSMIVGSIAGLVSVLGYQFLTPFLGDRLKIKDTCGVNNLHGMPGIIAGVVGVIMVSMASEEEYGSSLYKIFPAMAPNNGTLLADLQGKFSDSIQAGDGRTASQQAVWQLVALAVSLAMGIFGGMFTGLVLRTPIWNRPHGGDIYEDDPWWHVEEGQPELAPEGGEEMAYEAPPAPMKKHISHMHSLVQ